LFYVRLGLEVECLTLFAALTCVESLIMTVSSVVGALTCVESLIMTVSSVVGALTCVESLMMTVSCVVGRNFLAGIVIGAGIQVRDVQPQYLTSS
jgi:hypothetical protein